MSEQQIVVFCGPDKCGKTEIAKELERQTGIKYFKASSEKTNFKNNSERFIMESRWADPRQIDIIRQFNLSIIMDRGWPCEFAYGTVFRRKVDIDAIKYTDNAYSNMNATIVFCHRSNYDGRIDEDAPELLTSSTLKLIENEYRTYFNVLNTCHLCMLNVDNEDLVEQTKYVKNFLDSKRQKYNIV